MIILKCPDVRRVDKKCLYAILIGLSALIAGKDVLGRRTRPYGNMIVLVLRLI